MPSTLPTLSPVLSLLMVIAGFGLAAAEPPHREFTPPPQSRREPTQPNAESGFPVVLRTNKPLLQVSSAPQTIHGGLTVPTLIVVAEANKFSFLPPLGWRAQSGTSEKRIRLVRPDSVTLMTIDITEDKGKQPSPLSPETLRQELLDRHPGGRIVEEFPASAVGQAGLGFELEWRTGNDVRQLARHVFVRFTGGHLEFSLMGPAQALSQHYHDFNRLLLSFRSAALDTRLEVQPVVPE